MIATDITTNRVLGRLCGPDSATTGPRHRLLYLDSAQMVVLPYSRTSGGWECVIVATRALRQAHHLTLTDDQIAATMPTVPADAERDPDGYARLAWMSEAFRRWPGGAMLAFTRHVTGKHHIPPRSLPLAARLRHPRQARQARPRHAPPMAHTLGTALIYRDVPQEVVRRIIDHESPQMTAHYARLHDSIVRRHWEQARKVNMDGADVVLDPAGPLGDAAWAKPRLGRATQALPNG